jgi:hypothetical protein
VATRADIEQELVSRAEAWLTAASMAVTYAGANADLNSPIAWAIRQAGGSVTAPALVTSTDVQTVADADYDKLLDLAELRTLQSILGSYALVDAKAGPVEAKSSQLAERIERRIAELKAWLKSEYNIGGSSVLSFVPITYGVCASDEYSSPPNYWP